MKTPSTHSPRKLLGQMFSGLLIYLGLSSLACAQTPILFYDFNAGTGAAISTGSNPASASVTYGSNGSGVSGLNGDYALSISGTMGGTGLGAAAVSSTSLGSSLSGLMSFTLTGWFDAATTTAGGARLVNYTSGNNGIFLDFSAPGILNLQVNGTSGSNPAISVLSTNIYNTVNAWTFYAVTYNSITDTVTFSEGGKSGGLTSQSYSIASTASSDAMPSTTLYFGNNATPPSGTRAFNGLLDDMAIYGSTTDGSGALTLPAIDALYAQEVPEPNITASFLFGGVLLLFLLGRRQRRMI